MGYYRQIIMEIPPTLPQMSGMQCIWVIVAAGLIGIAPTPAAANAPPPTATAPSDAAALYRQAFTLLDRLDEDDARHLGMCSADECWVATTPLDRTTAVLAGRMWEAVNYARSAAVLPAARWEISGDLAKSVELRRKVPQLAGLLVLNARHELEAGQPEAAVSDLVATMALSRHAASEPNLMAKQLEAAAWRPAAEVLSRNLNTLPKNLIAGLPARLERLPPAPAFRAVLQGERETAGKLSGKQGLAAAAMAKSLDGFYQSLDAAADRPPQQFAARVDEELAKVPLNTQAKVIAPALKQVREQAAVLEARRAMLDTAIRVVVKGAAAVESSKDPFAEGPFGYKAHTDGFELSSGLRVKDRVVTLRVGPP